MKYLENYKKTIRKSEYSLKEEKITRNFVPPRIKD